MRTALIAGLLTALAVALLGVGQALTNADFIYMCAGAALLDRGELLVTPYFPPGYPALVWLVTKLGLLLWPGMTALHAGSILSAIGTGLSAGAVAYAARLYRLPPAPALMLGLLAASLPDMAEIAFNPHVDALYTGLAICLVVATLRRAMPGSGTGALAGGNPAKRREPSHQPASILAACICVALLLTLRWHAVLVVGPCLLLLFCIRQSRRSAFALLAVTILAAGFSYGALHARTGSLQSAAPLQVATGAVYRQYGPGREQEAVAEVFSDYALWMQTAPPVTPAMLLDAERANLPRFLTRKAVLAGVGLLLLLALVYRRWPPGALPLLLFIPGYCAAVATTYFTPRASALPELCGLVLAAAALHLPFTQREHELRQQKLEKRRLHFKPNGPSLALDYAALGTVISLSTLLVIGYNCYRVQRDLYAPWQAQRLERNAVYAMAVKQVVQFEDNSGIWGRFDLLPPRGQWSLPSSIGYTRLWMDDPRVEQQLSDVLWRREENTAPVVLLWPGLDAKASELAHEFDNESDKWESVEVSSHNARLWVLRSWARGGIRNGDQWPLEGNRS